MVKPVTPGSLATPREVEIIVLAGKGFTDKEIGRLLKLSVYTVSDHIRRLCSRLDVSSRVEAAVWATKQGLL